MCFLGYRQRLILEVLQTGLEKETFSASLRQKTHLNLKLLQLSKYRNIKSEIKKGKKKQEKKHSACPVEYFQ